MSILSCVIVPALIFTLSILPVQAAEEAEKSDSDKAIINPVTVEQATGKSEKLPGHEKTKTPMEFYLDGVEAMDDKDYDSAVRNLKAAIDLDPSNLEYQYFLGVVYSRLNMDEKALSIFQNLVEKDSGDLFQGLF